jgi:hypothetical protein
MASVPGAAGAGEAGTDERPVFGGSVGLGVGCASGTLASAAALAAGDVVASPPPVQAPSITIAMTADPTNEPDFGVEWIIGSFPLVSATSIGELTLRGSVHGGIART